MSSNSIPKTCNTPNCQVCAGQPQRNRKIYNSPGFPKVFSNQNMTISMQKSSSLKARLNLFNPYTIDLIFRLISRKCTDSDYMLLEKIHWQVPQYVYVRNVQIMKENSLQKILGNRPDPQNARENFELFYVTNFASLVTEILEKTFIRDIDKKISEIQKEHLITINRIMIVLEDVLTNTLCYLVEKYIDPKVVDELIQINDQMNKED